MWAERWLSPTPRPRFAYFSVWGGARTCIGNHFTLLSGASGALGTGPALHLALHLLVRHIDSHMTQISQLTLRGLAPGLQREIRELARRERISLNKAALRLLEKGAGLGERSEDCIGHSLDALIGTWTAKEAATLLESIKSCEQIDADLWE